MSAYPSPPKEFLALRAECEGLGYLWGMDFFIWYIPAVVSSEFIMFGLLGDDYAVSYSDMGHHRLVFRSPDFAPAREAFLEELAWLAAGRGRGPYVGRKSRAQAIADSMTVEEATALYFRERGMRDPRTEG